MVVFSEIIKYLKQHLLKLLETRGTGVDNKDIHWVLTVPAIWSDSAKQFMREAAQKVIFPKLLKRSCRELQVIGPLTVE
ncbi:hypothetical protein DPMN_116262 [Dreissena polymorpha]|uniref:Uncharacterized protein n=1 Tax=Dreissena polymorpha TaxID=45954 RepID=A0A9D4QTT1_DREPO|nr:hypothetical protein DPMN_116262 [Dreissena polymorpha]